MSSTEAVDTSSCRVDTLEKSIKRVSIEDKGESEETREEQEFSLSSGKVRVGKCYMDMECDPSSPKPTQPASVDGSGGVVVKTPTSNKKKGTRQKRLDDHESQDSRKEKEDSTVNIGLTGTKNEGASGENSSSYSRKKGKEDGTPKSKPDQTKKSELGRKSGHYNPKRKGRGEIAVYRCPADNKRIEATEGTSSCHARRKGNGDGDFIGNSVGIKKTEAAGENKNTLSLKKGKEGNASDMAGTKKAESPGEKCSSQFKKKSQRMRRHSGKDLHKHTDHGKLDEKSVKNEAVTPKRADMEQKKTTKSIPRKSPRNRRSSSGIETGTSAGEGTTSCEEGDRKSGFEKKHKVGRLKANRKGSIGEDTGGPAVEGVISCEERERKSGTDKKHKVDKWKSSPTDTRNTGSIASQRKSEITSGHHQKVGKQRNQNQDKRGSSRYFEGYHISQKSGRGDCQKSRTTEAKTASVLGCGSDPKHDSSLKKSPKNFRRKAKIPSPRERDLPPRFAKGKEHEKAKSNDDNNNIINREDREYQGKKTDIPGDRLTHGENKEITTQSLAQTTIAQIDGCSDEEEKSRNPQNDVEEVSSREVDTMVTSSTRDSSQVSTKLENVDEGKTSKKHSEEGRYGEAAPVWQHITLNYQMDKAEIEGDETMKADCKNLNRNPSTQHETKDKRFSSKKEKEGHSKEGRSNKVHRHKAPEVSDISASSGCQNKLLMPRAIAMRLPVKTDSKETNPSELEDLDQQKGGSLLNAEKSFTTPGTSCKHKRFDSGSDSDEGELHAKRKPKISYSAPYKNSPQTSTPKMNGPSPRSAWQPVYDAFSGTSRQNDMSGTVSLSGLYPSGMGWGFSDTGQSSTYHIMAPPPPPPPILSKSDDVDMCRSGDSDRLSRSFGEESMEGSLNESYETTPSGKRYWKLGSPQERRQGRYSGESPSMESKGTPHSDTSYDTTPSGKRYWKIDSSQPKSSFSSYEEAPMSGRRRAPHSDGSFEASQSTGRRYWRPDSSLPRSLSYEDYGRKTESHNYNHGPSSDYNFYLSSPPRSQTARDRPSSGGGTMYIDPPQRPRSANDPYYTTPPQTPPITRRAPLSARSYFAPSSQRMSAGSGTGLRGSASMDGFKTPSSFNSSWSRNSFRSTPASISEFDTSSEASSPAQKTNTYPTRSPRYSQERPVAIVKPQSAVKCAIISDSMTRRMKPIMGVNIHPFSGRTINGLRWEIIHNNSLVQDKKIIVLLVGTNNIGNREEWMEYRERGPRRRSIDAFGVVNAQGKLDHHDSTPVNDIDEEDLKHQYRRLVRTIRDVSGVRDMQLMLTSLIPRPWDYERRDHLVKQVNKLLKELSIEENFHFLEVYDLFLQPDDKPNNAFFFDGLHLSDQGMYILRNFYEVLFSNLKC